MANGIARANCAHEHDREREEQTAGHAATGDGDSTQFGEENEKGAPARADAFARERNPVANLRNFD